MIINLTGELDHHSAAEIRKQLDTEILKTQDKKIVLDLSGLTFMDSSGIGVLLGRYKLFAARRLYIRNASPQIDRILKLSGIYKIMPEYKGEAK